MRGVIVFKYVLIAKIKCKYIFEGNNEKNKKFN